MLRDVKEGKRSVNACKRGARRQPHSYTTICRSSASEGSCLVPLRNHTQRDSDKDTLGIHLHYHGRGNGTSRKGDLRAWPRSEVARLLIALHYHGSFLLPLIQRGNDCGVLQRSKFVCLHDL
jgi:hypothetical protein